jgi:hypothetical protein
MGFSRSVLIGDILHDIPSHETHAGFCRRVGLEENGIVRLRIARGRVSISLELAASSDTAGNDRDFCWASLLEEAEERVRSHQGVRDRAGMNFVIDWYS